MDRFAFGDNWQDFSKKITPGQYEKARQSLQELIGDLTGKSFLDVGCGSGLFSIAASALGAKKVAAFDFDPQCVDTARKLQMAISQWDTQLKEKHIEFSIGSILELKNDIGQFDIVYSWGVLHHTGNMYKAFEAITKYVAKGGLLVMAIYNKHWTSPLWKMLKYSYIKSPAIIRKLFIWSVFIIKVPAVMLTTGKNPLSKERGMNYYNDIVDWVGGYPYEYATPDEVIQFFEQRGFKLKKLVKTKGFTGCNEFVFERMI